MQLMDEKIQIKENMSLKNWITLTGLTLAAFVFNTSEFIPIALLSDIQADFSITEAKAGMLISVYAWMVMLLSLPLMIMASKVELRRLMLWLVALFAGFQITSFLSTGYYMLMASRIGVACTHAIFWSIVSVIAVRIVPAKYSSVALSSVVTGSSLAMVLGLPIGRIIGLQIGWRMTFLSIGIFAILTFIYLLSTLPALPAKDRFSVKELPALLKNRTLINMYIFTLMVATSFFISYSYIEPFLGQVAQMSDQWITYTLMIFGVAGFIGSVAFSLFYTKDRFRFMNMVLACCAAALILLLPASASIPVTIILCVIWGITQTAYNVSMQSEIISVSPEGTTAVSMSIFSGIFNLGIGSGALIGGYVCDNISISYIGIFAGGLCLLSLLYWLYELCPLLKTFYIKKQG